VLQSETFTFKIIFHYLGVRRDRSAEAFTVVSEVATAGVVQAIFVVPSWIDLCVACLKHVTVNDVALLFCPWCSLWLFLARIGLTVGYRAGFQVLNTM